MKQRSFSEPGCIGCEAHLDFGLSRYCAGFQNKKRRKPFRKSDPLYKAPKWCPKRKVPCEYRIYRYADEQSAVLARLMQDAKREKDFVFPLAHHYQLCAEGHTGLSPQAFFEQANDMESDCLLGEEELHHRRRGGDRHGPRTVFLLLRRAVRFPPGVLRRPAHPNPNR